jgi:DsbC/DsbD-like thiol-disulfide interchange protein
MEVLRLNRRNVALGLVASLLPAGAAMAGAERYRLRLIAGDPDDGTLRAGVDIELADGWKTYWRMPGDAGVPPQFDWSQSKNVKAIEMLWPAPARFIDAGGETVGYKDRVVFPLRITPQRPGDPVELRLEMFFGVCKDICIPVGERVGLRSWQGGASAETLISSFERRVPVRIDRSSALRATRAYLLAGEEGGLDLVLALSSSPPPDLDIFVEGSGTSYFRAPRRRGERTLLISIAGSPAPEKIKGAALKLTFAGENIALEQDITVE